MEKTPVLSVVIPAFNEEEFIQDTLESVLNQDFPYGYEVIVIDNGSTDATIQIVKQFPEIKLIEQPIKGVAIARNTGFKAAKAEIIVSTDADCRPPKDWLIKLFNEMQNDPNLLAIGGYAIFDDGTIPYVSTKIAHKIGLLKLSRIAFGAQALSTQNLAIRKSAWEKVGGFNEQIVDPIYLDDADLTIRVNKIGEVRSSRDIYVFASSRRLKGHYKNFAYVRLRAYAHYTRNWKNVIDDWYNEKLNLDQIQESISPKKIYTKTRHKLGKIYNEILNG